MFTGKIRSALSLSLIALALGACGGGGVSSVTSFTVSSATQDLTADPDGLTTVVTFSADAPVVSTANIEADNGAMAQSVVRSDSDLTIVWDVRVTPSDQIRFLGVEGLTDAFMAVETSDASAPSFVVTSATQGAGLGNDSIIATFSGPRVVAAQAADANNWEVVVGGATFSLGSSSVSFDETTQILSVLTDATVNLHADFDLRATSLTSVADVALAADQVTGTATGDSDAPTLVSLEQDLAADEFGRVVEFTFSEAVDPYFSASVVNFSTGVLVFPLSATLVSAERIQLTFSEPMIPGVDTIQVFGVIDAHGNEFPTSTQNIDPGSTVANAYDGSPELRSVAGVGGDMVVMSTVQAIDPADAEDAAAWTLEVDGNPVVLADQELVYDLLTKTLTITLDDDFQNGLGFDLTPVSVIDVDGQSFTTPFSGTVAGDVDVPTVSTVVQNRDVDSTGILVDVTFSEDVEQSSAENLGNWTVNGGLSITGVERLGIENVVRLTMDGAAVPGDYTIDASGVTDPAGNAMTVIVGASITSTDSTAPAISTAAATGATGLGNDTVTVQFDDWMISAEVTDNTNWTVESPVGNALDVSTATITYDGPTRTAVLTLVSASEQEFQVGDDFAVSLAGARDLGGNAVDTTPETGTPSVETDQPGIEAVWVRNAPDDDQVVVVFDEPVAEPDGFVTATLNDGTGTVLGTATAITRVSGETRQIEVTFGQAVATGSDTIDLVGVLDVAGNPAFPADDAATAPESGAALALNDPSSGATAISGEANDSLTLAFDAVPSTWNLFDLANYTLRVGGVPQELAGSTIEFDGSQTVTLNLKGGFAIQTGDSYTLEVDGLFTAQGVELTSADTAVVVAGGDAIAPTVGNGLVRLDPFDSSSSVIVEFDEAIDESDLVDTTAYAVGVTNPDSVTRLGARTARATFSGGIALSDTLDITVSDLAGNPGAVSRVVAAADSTAPTPTGATGTAVSGIGGDVLEVVFDEPVTANTATAISSYALTINGFPADLAGSIITYASTTNTATIALPPTVDFDAGGLASLAVGGVSDVSGNAMASTAILSVSLTGDTTPPAFEAAFVDFRASAGGDVVLVRFNEAITGSHTFEKLLWSSSGGQNVTQIEMLDDSTARLTLESALGAADTIDVSNVPDAGNTFSGALSIDPYE